MFRPKYVLHGGHVKCKDGDEHFISSHTLVRLYKLNPKDCISAFIYERGQEVEGMVHLYPSSNGNYEDLSIQDV